MLKATRCNPISFSLGALDSFLNSFSTTTWVAQWIMVAFPVYSVGNIFLLSFLPPEDLYLVHGLVRFSSLCSSVVRVVRPSDCVQTTPWVAVTTAVPPSSTPGRYLTSSGIGYSSSCLTWLWWHECPPCTLFLYTSIVSHFGPRIVGKHGHSFLSSPSWDRTKSQRANCWIRDSCIVERHRDCRHVPIVAWHKSPCLHVVESQERSNWTRPWPTHDACHWTNSIDDFPHWGIPNGSPPYCNRRPRWPLGGHNSEQNKNPSPIHTPLGHAKRNKSTANWLV